MDQGWAVLRVSATFALALTCAAGTPEGRPSLPLSGEWRSQFVEKPGDQPGDAWDKSPLKLPVTRALPKGKAGLWLERRVSVPMDWKSSRVVVHVGHPLYAVEVSVNGVRAGALSAYGGEVDVEPSLRCDGTDVLRLFFPREGGETVASDRWASKAVAVLQEHERSLVGVLGAPESLYLERQRRDIQIRDVWYQTFTRGNARVEPLITLWAARPLQNVKARVKLYDPSRPSAPVAADFALGEIPAGESVHSVDMPAKNLKWWSLRQPNLHIGQVSLLDADGRELDRGRPTEFGVREFWLQGRHYYLNNQRVNPTLDCYSGASLEDGLTLTYSKHAANGANLVHDIEDEASACDRKGMGLAAYGVAVGHNSPDLSDPDILTAYRGWVQEHLRKLRNHPSILFWALSTNYAGGDTFKPTGIGRSESMNWNHATAVLSYFEHHRADWTRPAYHHASVGTGDLDSGNVYFNHLPTQSVEDWMSAWQERGDRPFMFIEFMGAPLFPDYMKSYTGSSGMVSYATEYAARLAGDRAYAAETDSYRAYATHAVPRLRSLWDYSPLPYSDLIAEQLIEAQRRTYRACRYYGVPADAWVFPPPAKTKDTPAMANLNKLVKAAHEELKPDQCWIGGPAREWTSKAHQFHSGEAIVKSVLIVHDQAAGAEVVVKWEATRPANGAPAVSGEQKATLRPWSRTAVEFQLKAPENKSGRPEELELKAVVIGLDGAREITCEPFRCLIWPEPPAPAAGAEPFKIIDPEGESSAWLTRFGAKLETLTPEGKLGRVLVLGRRAMSGISKLPFTAADVAAGTRVLICEQHCGDLERMGFRTEDHCPRNVFARCPAHPVLSGIQDESMRDWRGDSTLLGWGPEGDTTRAPPSRRTYHWSNRGTVASNILETPHLGAFKAISDCEFDLAYTPLLSWRHGKGEIVFSQLDLSGRTDSDPAVEHIQRGIVNYFQTPLAGAPQNRSAVCAGKATQDKVAELGFSAKSWVESPDPATEMLVFGKDDGDVLNGHRSTVLEFAKAGGTVLLFPATKGILANLGVKGLSLKTEKLSGTVAKVDANALLDGVGPQHLHWREPIEMTKIESEQNSGFESLLGGLAGVMPLGKGRLVLLQTDPAAFKDFTAARADDERCREPSDKPLPDSRFARDRRRSLWQTMRLDSLILANLGLESSQPLVKTLFEGRRKMPFYAVDKWMLLGPIPSPADSASDPMTIDLAPLLADRSPEKPVTLNSDKSATWCAPSDFNNGLGVAGMVDLAKVYGVKERQTAVAVTQLWSTKERVATLEFGADWWMKIQLNGKEIFRTGTDIRSNMGGTFSKGFAFSVKARLRQGWNEVVCAVGSGSNGNSFWFRVSNPGDTKEEQALQPPKENPMLFIRFAGGGPFKNMSAKELEEAENAPVGFPLYVDPLTVDDDPYLYMRW